MKIPKRPPFNIKPPMSTKSQLGIIEDITINIKKNIEEKQVIRDKILDIQQLVSEIFTIIEGGET